MHRAVVFIAIKLFVVMTIMTGLLYPIAITLAGRLFFPWEASGSIIHSGPKAIGSLLLAQPSPDFKHFRPRPSAGNYAAVPSAASNLAVSSAALHDSVRLRAAIWKIPICDIPSDLVFSSGSGLDPHISPEAAMVQAERIAAEHGLSDAQTSQVKALIVRRTEKRQLGVFGNARVNVLFLNCDLEELMITRNK
jgi:K+-transporting ATPase ATPase C chain